MSKREDAQVRSCGRMPANWEGLRAVCGKTQGAKTRSCVAGAEARRSFCANYGPAEAVPLLHSQLRFIFFRHLLDDRGGFRSIGEVEVRNGPAMPVAQREQLQAERGCGDLRFAACMERGGC